ncbi:MAG: hypothetical protein J6P03_04570 [Opitutales bacterium]|nr:hypothetical protein [Opitutales bacterium]
MPRFSAIALMAASLAGFAFAENLAFLSDAPEDPEHSAIIYGANEMFKDLELRYKKDFKVKNITPKKDITPEAQAAALIKAEKDGCIGALVIPSAGDDSALKKAVSQLRAKKFFVATLRRDLPDSGRILFISSDSKKIIEALKREFIVPYSKSNIESLCIFHTEGEQFFNDPALAESFEKRYNKDVLDYIKQRTRVVPAGATYYSKFAGEFKHNINVLDSYGIVFFDASPLLDMSPIPPDTDRFFSVSLDIRPHIGYFLANRQITLAIGDDYFGFGYISAQRLIEARLDGALPQNDRISLPPIIYTPEKIEQFGADWLKFMQ